MGQYIANLTALLGLDPNDKVAANLFLSGPANGAAAVMTKRAITLADVAAITDQVLKTNSTPTFNGAFLTSDIDLGGFSLSSVDTVNASFLQGSLAATYLTGIVNTNRLGTSPGGLANVEFLRRDNTWQIPTAGVPSTRTISTATPLTGGGDLSADRTITIPVATTSVDGYLSHTDWTTFNGKGSGSVISVGLSLPGIFTVTNSPVTTSGTLTGTLANQNANLVFAGPSSGGAAGPTFRVLVAADIPSLAESKITNLTTDLAAKAPLANPTFTGGITTPLINGDNSVGLTISGNSSAGIKFSANQVIKLQGSTLDLNDGGGAGGAAVNFDGGTIAGLTGITGSFVLSAVNVVTASASQSGIISVVDYAAMQLASVMNLVLFGGAA